MKADFTRKTFQPGKNFSRVLMQQGRVQLDADWNEQASIELNAIRQLGADLLGPCAGPLATLTPPTLKATPGFAAFAFGANDPAPDAPDFLLIPGRYYVDGILCSNETSSAIVTGYGQNAANGAQSLTVFTWTLDGIPFLAKQYAWLYDATPGTTVTPVLLQITQVDYVHRTLTVQADATAFGKFTDDANGGYPKNHFLRRAPTYMTQPDYAAPPLAPGHYQAYLDVWEREISCAEDDSIREVALGGPDTAARARIMAQVKVMPQIAGLPADTCPTSWELAAQLQPPSRGCLAARANPAQMSTDPCTISPNAMYRGPENQLYRVEIHTGTDDTGDSSLATFKWSRENGAVVYPIAMAADPTYTLESLGRDDRFGLTEGDWVEIVDDGYVIANTPAPLRQVQSIDRVRMTVVLSGKGNGVTGTDATQHPMLRRWDEKAGIASQGGLTLGADNAALIFPAQTKVAAVKSNAGRIDVNTDIVAGRFSRTMTSPWFELEDGVQVQFTVPPQSDPAVPQFRSGDYWLIPARVATGNVEWPVETIAGSSTPPAPIAMLPDGPVHHYAPIAKISIGNNMATVDHDCTVVFGVGGGLLAFAQNGVLYTPNIGEEILIAPTQPHAPEMLVRPAKKPAVKHAATEAKHTEKK